MLITPNVFEHLDEDARFAILIQIFKENDIKYLPGINFKTMVFLPYSRTTYFSDNIDNQLLEGIEGNLDGKFDIDLMLDEIEENEVTFQLFNNGAMSDYSFNFLSNIFNSELVTILPDHKDISIRLSLDNSSVCLIDRMFDCNIPKTEIDNVDLRSVFNEPSLDQLFSLYRLYLTCQSEPNISLNFFMLIDKIYLFLGTDGIYYWIPEDMLSSSGFTNCLTSFGFEKKMFKKLDLLYSDVLSNTLMKVLRI